MRCKPERASIRYVRMGRSSCGRTVSQFDISSYAHGLTHARGHQIDGVARTVLGRRGACDADAAFLLSDVSGGWVSKRGRDSRGLRFDCVRVSEETAARTLAVTQNITADGSVEMLDDWFNPRGQADIDNSDLLEELHRQDSRADAFLVGRRTLEDLRGYWPERSDDATGIAEYLNRVQKYVVSSTMTDPKWQSSAVLCGDPVGQVGALKEQAGYDIVVTGSITLCHALIAGGLVYEYRLFVYPVVQGPWPQAVP